MKTALALILSLFLATQANAQFDNGSDSSVEDEVLNDAQSGSSSDSTDDAPVSKTDSSQELKRLDRAIKDREMSEIKSAAIRVLAKDSKNIEALNALALYHYSQKQNGAAKILLNRAIKYASGKAALYNNLGIIFLSENDKATALKYLRKAMDKDPNYEIGGTNLSSIYIEYMDYEKAINKLEDGYSKVKSDLSRGDMRAAKVANNYAIALIGLKKAEKAETIFERIVDSDIRDSEILINYAVLLVTELKAKKRAYKILSKVKFISDDSRILNQVNELERMADEL